MQEKNFNPKMGFLQMKRRNMFSSITQNKWAAYIYICYNFCSQLNFKYSLEVEGCPKCLIVNYSMAANAYESNFQQA